MNRRRVPLLEEIRQKRPFSSAQEETAVGLLRTADLLRRRVAAVLEPLGISGQQYNVLRILRGAHPEPLPTLEIAERLIERTPGITRLLDRLEAKSWVRRKRCSADRRQVHCWITESGLALLRGLDRSVPAAIAACFTELSREEVERLASLLEQVRAAAREDG
ncbi:MAG: MarR family transcriptional regulator [Thermoanaerobaculia bacterium]